MMTRLLAILRLLSQKSEYTTIEQIAEGTGAGVRTIHRDLELLERSLSVHGVRLERRRGYGVRLIDPLPKRLMEGVGQVRSTVSTDSGQRPLMVLLYLIIAADWIKLAEIAHVLFVSDSTVSRLLDTLQELLPASLVIDRQKGTGVRLTGEEHDLRLIYLSAFPSLMPVYLITSQQTDGPDSAQGEERLIRLLKIRESQERFIPTIKQTEELIGYPLSPTYWGLVYAYLYVLEHRLPLQGVLTSLPDLQLAVPQVYHTAAEQLLRSQFSETIPEDADLHKEVVFLAHLLASCETSFSTVTSVEEYLGDLSADIHTIIEHALSRLEVSRKIWLHDNRLLMNYLEITLAAAARRIDLGIPYWREYGLYPFPGMEDTPEAAALLSEFLAELGRILKEPPPSLVRREIIEASLALGAHVESIQSRHVTELRVKVLCIEGLGMSSYLTSILREILPKGVLIDAHWEPEIKTRSMKDRYDLVVSSYPLYIEGVPHVVVNGDSSPRQIRDQLIEETRSLVDDLKRSAPISQGSLQQESSGDPPQGQGLSSEVEHSLPVIMSMITDFFVVSRDPTMDVLEQAIGALNTQGDCDTDRMLVDFSRRESYGSLVFEEFSMRILHCRTEGIPVPRAGVIQHEQDDYTILVLAAPLTASPAETQALSEVVIALSDYEDFATVLSQGDKRGIQSRLLSLFSQKLG